ncbi:hypothetical protein RhiLY_13196 [Ceratobasidium sp. AG-Ba]|nr:hypothetical protein RhiLY_13196 [Ceratobasidium sp. AG-Ba]
MVHDALRAAGHSEIGGKLEDITETYFGEDLHPFYSGVVQSGDLLLVPSELKSFSLRNLKNITWWQTIFSRKRAESYCFTVPNHTQKGLDVFFFIQKDWWDSDSTSENHISKIASKNEQGAYAFTVDEKSQYGQSDKSGTNCWVI